MKKLKTIKLTPSRNGDVHVVAGPSKLDIGCGSNKKAGFYGIDSIAFDGVDKVVDITVDPWPFASDTVEEFHSSHVIEHLTWPQRITFFNELYRILKPGGKGQLILPHWASMRYYGDPTHQAPMSEFAFYYLSRKWRLDEKNAPHTDIKHNPNGYNCNFEVVWGHSLHQALNGRNQEYVTHALTFFKEAAQDIIANMTKL
jgi:Methyltransferase domain